MRILQCKLTTIEAMLGTASNNKELHSEFIASHAPDAPSREEEIEAVGVEEVIEKGMTVFSRNKDGKPILWDYQIKGFFKDACGVLRKVKGTKSSKIKAYKKEIDGLIFVQERQIPVQTAEEMGSCQRSLRANTPQGERVGLANSKGIAWQGDGQQRKGIDKLCMARARQGRARHSRAKASQGIAWQCLARALRSEAKRGEGIAKPRKA